MDSGTIPALVTPDFRTVWVRSKVSAGRRRRSPGRLAHADGGLQLVSDRVNERIVLFVASYLANEESGVEDDTGDDQEEKDDAKNQQRDFAGVEQNPANIQRDSQRHQASAQGDEEGYRLTATTYCHAAIVRPGGRKQ